MIHSSGPVELTKQEYIFQLQEKQTWKYHQRKSCVLALKYLITKKKKCMSQHNIAISNLFSYVICYITLYYSFKCVAN